MPRSKLTAKMRAFVREFVVCRNGAEAARRAGYSKDCARELAYKLLQRPDIRAAVRAREEGEERLVGSRKAYVLNGLEDLHKRAVQVEPVRDGKGQEIGVFKYDGATAARALELLGKHEGLFNDRIDLRVQGELEALVESVRSRMNPQAYAELVRALAEITGVTGVDPASASGDRSDAVH